MYDKQVRNRRALRRHVIEQKFSYVDRNAVELDPLPTRKNFLKREKVLDMDSMSR